jgi:hypothetical protein
MPEQKKRGIQGGDGKDGQNSHRNTPSGSERELGYLAEQALPISVDF